MRREINWLIGYQEEANFLYENLNEDQVIQDDILLTDPDAILSAKLILHALVRVPTNQYLLSMACWYNQIDTRKSPFIFV